MPSCRQLTNTAVACQCDGGGTRGKAEQGLNCGCTLPPLRKWKKNAACLCVCAETAENAFVCLFLCSDPRVSESTGRPHPSHKWTFLYARSGVYLLFMCVL